MKTVIDWIRHHQIVAFYIITFVITWGLGFSYGAVIKQGLFLLAPLVFVATCGPALAGILISWMCNTRIKSGTSRAQWIAFFIALAGVSAVFLAHNKFINHTPLSPMMVGVTLVIVLPVAYIISAAFSRVPAVKDFLASLFRVRGVWGWLLLALVLIPALVLLSVLISSILGRKPITDYRFPAGGLTLVGLIVVKFLYQFFFFNCIGEEIGWRGFALPRLQARINPLVASVIISLFWLPWHFFLWQAEGQPVFTWNYWLMTLVNHLPASILFGWLYNRSRGSILVAGIIHAAANTTFAFLPSLDVQVYTVINFAATSGVIVLDRMWKKLPSDHPAVVQVPELIY